MYLLSLDLYRCADSWWSVVAQRQTIIRLLQKRFQPSEKQIADYHQQVEQITDVQSLTSLIDALLDVKMLAQFDEVLITFPPNLDKPELQFSPQRH